MKTKTKKLLSILMCLTLILSTLTLVGISANAETSGDFEYSLLYDDTVEIIRYNGSATELEIPSTIDGKAVTSIYGTENHIITSGIDSSAFSECTSLITVTIPNSVINIGDNAFFSCTSLTSVTIPDSVTVIDSYAFYGCTALKSITIPEKVTNIGLNAFTNCTALTSIAIPDSVTDIDSYAFSECAALTSVTIGSGLLTIDIFSFSDCTALKRITIPDNVTTIEFMALGYYWDKDIGDYIKVDDFTIIGNPNTEAERYANENGINFVDLTNHTHLYTEEITKQPTCTEKGVKTYTCFCSDSYTEEISVLGHKVVIDKAKSPTCTNTGLTEGKHCSVCGEILVKQVVAPTKSHNCKWIVAKKASYFSKGTKSYKCSVCGKVTKITTVAKLKLKTPSFSVSGVKKLFKVKYTKVTDATGFEVKYTIGKKTVTKTFSTKKSITKTISGLKKGSYKVRIRAFVKQSGKTAYSNWTKTKTVKVK